MPLRLTKGKLEGTNMIRIQALAMLVAISAGLWLAGMEQNL
jgi:hypothetical protein